MVRDDEVGYMADGTPYRRSPAAQPDGSVAYPIMALGLLTPWAPLILAYWGWVQAQRRD